MDYSHIIIYVCSLYSQLITLLVSAVLDYFCNNNIYDVSSYGFLFVKQYFLSLDAVACGRWECTSVPSSKD